VSPIHKGNRSRYLWGAPVLGAPRPFSRSCVIRSLVTRASLLALALAPCGCALTLDSSQLGVPVSLAAGAQQSDSGAAFRVTKHSVYMFVGLLSVAQPNLEDVLAAQVGTGARITNLRIKVRSRWSDLLVTGLTLGLVVPRSVTFEGTVVGK